MRFSLRKSSFYAFIFIAVIGLYCAFNASHVSTAPGNSTFKYEFNDKSLKETELDRNPIPSLSDTHTDKVINYTNQVEFFKEMERRRLHVYETCARKGYAKFRRFQEELEKKGFDSLLNDSPFLGGLIKVDDRHNYTLTVVPKAAATTLTQIVTFTRLAGSLSSTRQVSLGRGNTIKLYKPGEIVSILLNFKKAVVVRDPLSRLVSAWNDKFKKTRDTFVYLGQKILHHVLPNANISEVKPGYPFHFNEFLSWMDSKNGYYQNFHWIQVANLTNICGIPYDYVIRFENLQEELRALINLLTGTGLPDFPSSNAKMSNKRDYEAEFKDVVDNAPKEKLVRVLKTYKDDYDIFEYLFPF